MPWHGQIPGKVSLWKKCCLNPGLSHFHMNRLRGIRDEEDVSYPETFISTASTAVWWERIHCHSWLPVWSSLGGEKVKVVCAKQHRCTVTPALPGQGLGDLVHALIQAHRKGMAVGLKISWQLLQGGSCWWEKPPHQGSQQFCQGENCLLGVPEGLLGTQHLGTNLYLWGKASYMACCDRKRRYCFALKEGQFRLNARKKVFFSEDSEILAWAAQCPIPGSSQSRVGWGSEQLDQVEDVSAHCRGAGTHRLEGSLLSLCWCSQRDRSRFGVSLAFVLFPWKMQVSC